MACEAVGRRSVSRHGTHRQPSAPAPMPRLEAGIPVPRHGDFHRPGIGEHGFLAVAVTGIAAVTAVRVILPVAEVIIELALQSALDHHLGQFAQQAALAGQLQPAGAGPLGQLPQQLLIRGQAAPAPRPDWLSRLSLVSPCLSGVTPLKLQSRFCATRLARQCFPTRSSPDRCQSTPVTRRGSTWPSARSAPARGGTTLRPATRGVPSSGLGIMPRPVAGVASDCRSAPSKIRRRCRRATAFPGSRRTLLDGQAWQPLHYTNGRTTVSLPSRAPWRGSQHVAHRKVALRHHRDGGG